MLAKTTLLRWSRVSLTCSRLAQDEDKSMNAFLDIIYFRGITISNHFTIIPSILLNRVHKLHHYINYINVVSLSRLVFCLLINRFQVVMNFFVHSIVHSMLIAFHLNLPVEIQQDVTSKYFNPFNSYIKR